MDDTTRQLIAGYHPPDGVIERLREIPLIILTGITGAGKNTIMNDIIMHDDFERAVTSTTRAPRANDGVMEVEARDYYFLTVEQAQKKMETGEYIEVADVHGRVNGSLIKEYERIAALNKTVVTDIDYQGAQHMINFELPKLTVLFIVPPSFEVWLERLSGRYGDEEIDTEDLARRLSSAKVELDYALQHDAFIPVMNDVSKESAQTIIEFTQQQTLPSVDEVATAHGVVRQLLTDIDSYLQTL
jgi:guanylate kinase